MRRLLACSARYWCQLAPQARTELAHWNEHARSLPDAHLRGVALSKLHGEGLNPEGAAFIALLATDRPAAVRGIVAFQILYELLDGLTEGLPFAECLRLHERLRAILQAELPRCDTYTTVLINAARALRTPELALAIQGVCEAQSHNHAPEGQIRAWAERQQTGLFWWETAAAGISSIGVLALLASPPKRHPGLTDAYLRIDALASLLDAVRDRASDELTGNHNFTAHYETEAAMSERLQTLLLDGERAVHGLPNGAIHRMVLAGLLAYNLSAMPEDLGLRSPLVRLGTLVMRLRRAASMAHVGNIRRLGIVRGGAIWHSRRSPQEQDSTNALALRRKLTNSRVDSDNKNSCGYLD